MQTVDLTTAQPEPSALARVPVQTAQRYDVMPLRFDGETLELAMADPFDIQRLDELQMLLRCAVRPCVILTGDLAATIRQHYGVGAGVPGGSDEPTVERVERATEVAEAAGVVRLVNDLIRQAYLDRASDLHLGLGPDGPWIQERVDGMLYEVPTSRDLTRLYKIAVSRLKIMANLDIAEHRLPQDGRIWFTDGGAKLDLRVSVLPTLHGENLVVRLIEPSQILGLEQLGLHPAHLASLEGLLAQPTGLLLVTGPTGSGKTTSLYAFLSRLNTGQNSLVTIEDPIEHELSHVTQIQVQPKIGLTFATGLRSMLRHDPDVIMVGEIRDQETANLAIRAALTGHLVLATLHTNDAPSGITRLVDLGIEPFLLSSTLSAILSQRLVRVLCERCREPVTLDLARLGTTGIELPAGGEAGTMQAWRARGCQACRSTGYHGRTGLFELCAIEARMRSLMQVQTSSVQLRQIAIAQGMQTLWRVGWDKVLAGITSLDELLRVLPRELRRPPSRQPEPDVDAAPEGDR